MARILIVDDRPFNRQFLMTMLANSGHALSEASDGQAALNAIRDRRPDLVMTDVLMPVMDGFELARQIRRDPALADLPIIFYTSTFRVPEARALAAASGVNAVLTKPSPVDVILETIDGLLTGSPRTSRQSLADRARALQLAAAPPVAPETPTRTDLPGAEALHKLNGQLTLLIEATFEVRPQQGAQHVAGMFFDLACKTFDGLQIALVVDTVTQEVPIARGLGVATDLVLAAWSSNLLAKLVPELYVTRIGDSEHVLRLTGKDDGRVVIAARVASSEHRYGWLYVGVPASRAFTREDERMLLTVAGEFAVFYEAAEVHELLQGHAARLQVESAAREKAEAELRKRYREQAAVAEFSVAAISAERFGEQIERAAEIVCAALEADVCAVIAVNATKDNIRVLSARGWRTPFHDYKFSSLPKTSILYAALEKGGVRFSDITGALPFMPSELFAQEGIRSGAIECSLYGRTHRIVVAVYGRAPREFAPAESDFLRSISNAIAILQDREQALEHLRLRDRGLQAISQGITITDETGASPVLIYSNPAFQRMTGYSAEELIGKPSKSLLTLTNNEDLRGQIALARAKRRDIRFEAKMQRKDGDIFIDEVAASPIVGADGTLTHTVAVHDDVTEARRRDERMHESQKLEAIGQLTGGIAHDFNNLLTVIKANAEDLLQDLKDDELKGRQVELMLLATNRGADLVQQMMSFARKQELEPVAVDVNALLTTFGKLLSRTLPENIRLVVRPGPDMPAVLADPSRLDGALLNLSLNSRDAMPSGGVLTIETQMATLDRAYATENPGVAPGAYVMIAVSDQGHGMPKDVQERAFQPFFTTKPVGKGTGLGLSMVYGFVKQSGGHANIYSEVGVGTTIKLYLPPAQATKTSIDLEIEERVEVHKTTGCAVLLVEDDELVRQTVWSKLERLGFFVTPAASAAEAIKLLEEKSHFDLVFTDVIMPGAMTGADLAREVMQRWPGKRILMTSGYTEATALGKIQMPENIRLLSKPYANADLLRMIQEVMAAPPPTPAP